jgi:hypothetical protein
MSAAPSVEDLARILRAGADGLAAIVGVAVVHYEGWSFALGVDPKGTWRLSARLTSPKRGSTEADWRRLGAVTAAFGAPEHAVMPVALSEADAPMLWEWREDAPRGGAS